MTQLPQEIQVNYSTILYIREGAKKNLLPHILSRSLLYFGGDQLRITLLPPRNSVESLHQRIKEQS
jgi:hypothetical protein